MYEYSEFKVFAVTLCVALRIYSPLYYQSILCRKGTIVEWTAQIGQGVKEGDVVALVETDKVTLEIKASLDGVVTQQFGAV